MKSAIFLILSSLLLFAAPSWFYKLQKPQSNVYMGYGEAIKMQDAKQQALSDIASQISTHIESKLRVSTAVDSDEKVQRASSSNILQSTNANISDYKLLKSEYEDGHYFVALSYENIPSLDKFVKKLKKKYDFNAPNTSRNSRRYLDTTGIAHRLKKTLGSAIDFSLLRKDKKWFIQYKDILQVLDKKDFSRLFTTVSFANITLHTSKQRDILYDGDKFYFNIQSDKGGYVSIVTVYEDGTVATLVRNIKITKNSMQKIPDENFELIPEAGLMQKGVETFDLYVLIYSKKRLHFDDFAYADSVLINEEKYKNFDALVEFLDDKEFTTLKVVTKPRI